MDNNLKYYLAGIVDGEGYIGIKKTHKKEQVSPYYHERVSIGMTNEEIIDLFHKFFGGSKFYRYRLDTRFNSNLPYWNWEISDKKAAEFCRFFVDILIVKKRQAKLVIKLRESKEKGQIRNKNGLLVKRLLNEREKYYQNILEIHGRKRKDYYK